MDRERDVLLGINTCGLRDWDRDNAKKYNRTESTPYKALDYFFEQYDIDTEKDKMVDFGCGKGRMLFYVYDNYKIPVTGIELNDTTYDELSRNIDGYCKKSGIQWPDIRMVYGYAEKYQIQEDENIFYFFNPFCLNIFKQCVRNIEKSLRDNPRDVDIILYYPLDEFISFMEKATVFKRGLQVRLYWKKDDYKKFVVFEYRKE